MAVAELVVAVLVGAVQGVVEWLPVSSEGVVALVLAGSGVNPATAVQLALTLHAGTAVAATVYYRRDIVELVGQLPDWRPVGAFDEELGQLTFLAVATVVSGVVGVAGYWLLLDAASELSGGLFIAVIGGLLIVTGLVQRAAGDVTAVGSAPMAPLDAVLVGVGQGLAVLPGISRSGTTVSVLLLRGYRAETAFDLSFLLAIPASLGAGVLALGDAGGATGLTPAALLAAFVASGVIGYLTIGVLLDVVRRVSFWAVCTGFGGLAVVGGIAVIYL